MVLFVDYLVSPILHMKINTSLRDSQRLIRFIVFKFVPVIYH
jgi:hypothetical protein